MLDVCSADSVAAASCRVSGGPRSSGPACRWRSSGPRSLFPSGVGSIRPRSKFLDPRSEIHRLLRSARSQVLHLGWPGRLLMTMLKLLPLGAGLGSIWICSRQGAATAHVGCAINCANFCMQYMRGVKPFWLHIAYHGCLDGYTWHTRVMAAMRMALATLLRGEDVAVHCVHGTLIGNIVCGVGCLHFYSNALNISKVRGA